MTYCTAFAAACTTAVDADAQEVDLPHEEVVVRVVLVHDVVVVVHDAVVVVHDPVVVHDAVGVVHDVVVHGAVVVHDVVVVVYDVVVVHDVVAVDDERVSQASGRATSEPPAFGIFAAAVQTLLAAAVVLLRPEVVVLGTAVADGATCCNWRRDFQLHLEWGSKTGSSSSRKRTLQIWKLFSQICLAPSCHSLRRSRRRWG